MWNNEKIFQKPAEADYFDLTGTVQAADLKFQKQGNTIFCSDEKSGIYFQICYQLNGNRLTAVIPTKSRREEKGCKLRSIALFPGFCCGRL